MNLLNGRGLTVIGCSLLVGGIGAITLWPSNSGSGVSTYSPVGYTKAVDNLIKLQWLTYNDPVRYPGRPLVQLSPEVAAEPAIRRFAKQSYLKGDLAAQEPSLWTLRSGLLDGIDPNAHNIELPISRTKVWKGDLTFRRSEEMRGELIGPEQASFTLLPITGRLAADDPGIMRRDAFRPGPSSTGMRLLLTQGDRPLARVFLLGRQMYVRTEDERSATIHVDGGEALPAGEYRALPPGTELRISNGARPPASYLSRGVSGLNAFLSHFQPLAGRFRNAATKTFAVAFENEMGRLVRRAPDAGLRDNEIAGLQNLDVQTSLDPELQARLQRELEVFCDRGRNGGKGFRAAVTVLDARTGEILAIASYPATESQGAGTNRAWTANQNFVRLPIGSAAKPLVASAILEIWPELSTFQVPTTAGVEFDTVLGRRINPAIGDHGGGATMGFTEFIKLSNNQYASSLMLLALARNPLETSATSGSGLYSVNGQWRAALPTSLQLDRQDGIQTATATLRWPGEMDRLYDIGSEHIAREGTLTAFDDERYDEGPWRLLLDRLPRSRALLTQSSDFHSVSPERVNLRINTAVDLRNDYLPIILGGSTSRWTNIKLAESYARLVTGQRIQARFLQNGPAPTPMTTRTCPSGAVETRRPDGMFCDGARGAVLAGMALVATPDGTAKYRLPSLLAQMQERAAREGEVLGFYSKTGTPQIPDPRSSAEIEASRALGQRNLLAFNTASRRMGFRIRGGFLAPSGPADFRTLTESLRADPQIWALVQEDERVLRDVIGRVFDFNRSSSVGVRNSLYVINTDGRVVGIPVNEGKKFGSSFAFVAGRYATGDRAGGGGYQVGLQARPRSAYAVAINIQHRWGANHLAVDFASRILPDIDRLMATERRQP